MKNALLLTVMALVATTTASAQTLINGAGSTFDYPILSKWFAEYAKVDPSVRFNYQPIGSGAGLAQVTIRTVDFGASDAPMTDKAIARVSGKILHFPIVTGAEAVVYNLPGHPHLRLDGPAIAGIYLGTITKWNDRSIAAQNPGTALPEAEIMPIFRSDGSGTTYIFTDYLSSVSPAWASKVGKGVAVQWPTGLGANGNVGVAQQVKDSPGGIGYVELTYAKQNHMAYADLKNAAGHYVAPTLESMSAAVSTASIPDDFRFSMVNAPRATAYPIAGASWLILYQKQADATRGRKLVEFIRWAVTDGQKLSSKLDYGPLPEELVQRILKQADQVSY